MKILKFVLLCLFGCLTSQAIDINYARLATVKASSEMEPYVAANVKDGIVSDESRWLAAANDSKPWIELEFKQPIKVGMIDVFAGYKDRTPLSAYNLSLLINDQWEAHADWQMRNNKKFDNRVYIDRENVSKIRLELINKNPGRIREIAVYDNKEAQGLSFVKNGGSDLPPEYQVNFNQHQAIVNQVGYETHRIKRFTAPLSEDGVEFKIKLQGTDQVLFKGKIDNNIGDFTAFKPNHTDKAYRIFLSDGNLKDGVSDPFLIRNDLYKEQFWQAAVDFLNDGRSVMGTHPSAYGGCSWRDGTYYDAIVPALIKFYLADPKFIDSMPVQIDWQDEKKRVLAADFFFDHKNPCSGGVLEATRDYYTKFEAPKANAPDVIKLIHWGAGYILMKPNGRDPSARHGKASRIEPQTVEQIAYVLWAWPQLKKWLPQSFYDSCRDFCFTYWEKSRNKKGNNSLDISELWDTKTYMTTESFSKNIHNPGNMHPFKGRHAIGHSIVPNLIMYQVAKREGRKDAQKYMNAAINQTQWIIKNTDWNDPRTTKGHRLSEHRTIPNLVWFLKKYPKQAPKGLKEKITEWAEVAVSRSNNLWDFRRYDDQMWTIPGMNEVGNSLSVPAIALAASSIVDDPMLKKQLHIVATGAVDHVFGRNPMLAAAVSHPKQGFPEVERGWPKKYKLDVCARLENVRGNIASLPGSGMYPFNPGAEFRHLEGWVNYGASWCISLSYLERDSKKQK